MADEIRDFKGVWITKEVWLDTRLNALDKIILTEIDSLDQGDRGCFASNKYIADFCQCSETKVSKSISLLIKLGYVYVQSFDGRQRELKSRLSNNAIQPCKKDKADKQKMQESNIDNKTFNSTNIERGETPKRKRFVPPTLEEVKEYCLERKNNVDPQRFINYYTSNGWMVGKNKMKDWKAAVRTWEKNGFDNNKKTYGENGIAIDQNAVDDLADIF